MESFFCFSWLMMWVSPTGMSNLSWFAGETQLAAELNNLGWVNSNTVIVSREASHSSEQLFLDIFF